MRSNYIRRFLSVALLLAFTAPSGVFIPVCDAQYYGNSTTLAGDVMLTNSNDKITLSLRDSDITQVMRMFADKAGMNIVFHESVKGNVTLDLVDVPINEAFALLLQIAGLNYYVQNNTLIIIASSSSDNASFSKQEMMVFPVNYVDASKIAKFLNKNIFGMKRAGLSGVDAATVNSATNEIILFGMPSDAAIVEKVIAQLDREPLTRTFAVNHTTPKEMADMICDVLLPSRGSSGSSDGGAEVNITPTPGIGTSLGGAAGILTGGAAPSSSSSDDGIVLGEGVLACSVSSGASSSGFDVQNLSISYFPTRGTITMMGGSEAQQRMVENFIKSNDLKQPQAYLEVSIVELTEDGSKEFSNVWTLDSKHWSFAYDGSSSTVGRTHGTRYTTVDVVGEDGTSLETQYVPASSSTNIAWQLNYVIENSKGRLLANPKLLVTNAQESVIDLTQDYVEKVTSEFLSSTSTGSGASGTTQKTYTIGKDKGIKVSMTPFISPDGYVTMNIKPEYATEYDRVYSASETGDGNDLAATLLSRRNLDLKNIRIKDGETLAIGGLIQENDTKVVSKIPVLGDLPIIGAAFRSSNTTKSKSELVILITPRIINDGASIADSL